MSRWNLWALLALIHGVALAQVEGQVEQLVAWQESPLDLLDADARELVLLPGIGTELADSIIRLREFGRLQSVEDLSLVPGIHPSVVDAVRPYVRVGPDAPRGRVGWTTIAQHRAGTAPQAIHRLFASGSGVHVAGVLVDGPDPRRRGAVRVDGAGFRLFAGQLRISRGGGLFELGAGRSRVAPAARPGGLRVRERTDSSAEPGWSALAAAHRTGLVFVGRDARGKATAGAGLEFRGSGLDLHAALRADAVGWAASLDVVRSGSAWLGLTSDGRARSGRMGVRVGGQQWRAGIDATTTDAPLGMGFDPVTGHRLDRVHRCVQLHGRLRRSGWSVGGLWRDLARGGADPVATVEFEVTWTATAGGWIDAMSARMRAAPERRITLLASRQVERGEWLFRFAREASGASQSEALGAEYRVRTTRQELRLAAVGVDGNASRVWMLSRPGTGIYPIWVRPPGGLLGAGWGLRGGVVNAGAWIWLRADSGRPPAPGVGLVCSVEAGGLVRRLQGLRLSGTGGASRRSSPARPWRPQR